MRSLPYSCHFMASWPTQSSYCTRKEQHELAMPLTTSYLCYPGLTVHPCGTFVISPMRRALTCPRAFALTPPAARNFLIFSTRRPLSSLPDFPVSCPCSIRPFLTAQCKLATDSTLTLPNTQTVFFFLPLYL